MRHRTPVAVSADRSRRVLTLEACLRWCAVQIHIYFTLLCVKLARCPESPVKKLADGCCHGHSARVACKYCSPFENVDTAGQLRHDQQPAFTDHTSDTLYANDAVVNSGTYEELSIDHATGTMHVMVRALYDYEAVEDDELSLTAGKITRHAWVKLLRTLILC